MHKQMNKTWIPLTLKENRNHKDDLLKITYTTMSVEAIVTDGKYFDNMGYPK